jgi:AGZA family xanthine/uracil permease-like MFS transporter
VVTFHPIQRVLAVQDWNISEHGGSFAIAFITFLYVDILDCTGTMSVIIPLHRRSPR